MPHKKLVVYTGPQVSTSNLLPRLKESFRGAAIHPTGPADLLKPETLDHNTLAFFLPGIIGEDSPYSKELGMNGNAAIRKYVEEGGVFVGICAGAYYACRDITYAPPWRKEAKSAKPGLDLFNALASGPLPALARKGDEFWFSDCRVANVTYRDEKGAARIAGIAYGNGPALIPYEEDDLEIIARYDDEPGRPIAIAAKKIGKGLAIFVGVLPYIGYDATVAASSFPALQELSGALRPHEEGRAALWNIIVSRIKHHNADLGRVRLLQHPDPV